MIHLVDMENWTIDHPSYLRNDALREVSYYYSHIAKSHTNFPFVPKVLTLNGVMAVILRNFTELVTFVGN